MASLILLAALGACSDDAGRGPEVHDIGAPPVEARRPAPQGPVEGVALSSGRVEIDGERLFRPGSTELSDQAEVMLAKAADHLGRSAGPVIRVEGHAPDAPTALRLAQSTVEGLAYLGGAPFDRLEPRGVVDPAPDRRIVLTLAS